MDYKDFLDYRIKKYETAHSILGELFSGYIKATTFKDIGKRFTAKSFTDKTLHKIEDKLHVDNADLIYGAMLLLERNNHVGRMTANPNDLFDVVISIS